MVTVADSVRGVFRSPAVTLPVITMAMTQQEALRIRARTDFDIFM